MSINPKSVGLLAYQCGLLAAVAGLAFVLIVARPDIGGIVPTAGLALAAAIAERARVRLGANLEASISLIPTVFAAAVLSPLAGLIVGAASVLGDCPPLLPRTRREELRQVGAPWLRWTVYTCTRALGGGGAGCAAWLAASRTAGGATSILVATAVAVISAELLDVALVALTLRLRGHSARAVAAALLPMATASVPLYGPLIAFLGIAYTEFSPWTLAFFFGPALAAQRLFALYQAQRESAEGLARVNGILEKANLSFASALVATLDARDRYTAGHSAAVAIYARDIAARMALSEGEQGLAHLCGLVHDIGKIGLPAGLLEKPGALTLDERREMQRHSEIGERILENVETYAEIAAVVRHHHERMDGNGYPDGLMGESIPLLARIIAVADAYNAMTSDRPYRDAMPTRVARLRLAQAVETQFDTSVVAAFEAILAGASEEYRKAQSSEFSWLTDEDADNPSDAAPVVLAS
jgi:hypothetical protein